MVGLASQIRLFGAPPPPEFDPSMPMYVPSVSLDFEASAEYEARAMTTWTILSPGGTQKDTNKQVAGSNAPHCKPMKISLKGGDLWTEALSPSAPTTLRISNITCRCTVWEVLELILDSGFQGSFEYLYMPMKPKSRQNKGYAFVAFADTQRAVFFQSAIGGSQFRSRASSKSIDIEMARTHVPMADLLAIGFQIKQSQLGLVLELPRH